MNMRFFRLPGIAALMVLGASAQAPVRMATNNARATPGHTNSPDTGCSSPASLRMATVAPRGTSVHRALQAMGQKWKQCGVDLTIFTGAEMSGEADIVRRMGVGQIQAAMLSAVGLGEIEPGVTALQMMPMIFHTLDEVSYVREHMQPMLEARLREKGYVPLFWADIGWVHFFAKKELLNASEVKRRKMFAWAGDTAEIEIQKSAGYKPVPLEVGDILMGLDTGQIEVVAQPPFFALAGQLDKFAPHMTNVNWAPIVGAAVVRKPAWESLSPAGREQLLRAAIQTGTDITAAGRQESEDSVKAMKARGLVVHNLTMEQAAGWQKAAEELHPKLRGRTVPADVFDEVVRLLAEYRSRK